MRAAVVLALLFVSACGPAKEESGVPGSPKLLSVEDAQRIEDLTALECKCRMAGRDVRAITAELVRLMKGIPSEGLATASDPVSFENLCFPSAAGETCVFTQGNLRDGMFVCTGEQADQVERVWNDAVPESGGSADQADAAAAQLVADMREKMNRAVSQADCDLASAN